MGFLDDDSLEEIPGVDPYRPRMGRISSALGPVFRGVTSPSPQPSIPEPDASPSATIAKPALSALRGVTANAAPDAATEDLESRAHQSLPRTPDRGSTEDLETRPLPNPFTPPIPETPAATRPTRAQFPADKMRLWQKILTPLAVGAMEYGHPGSGMNALPGILGAGEEDAQHKYETATGEFDKTEAQRVAAENAASETGLRSAQAEKDRADAEKAKNPAVPKGEAEQPLNNAAQMGQALTRRFQVLHPGQPLDPAYQLPPNATVGDYNRINAALGGEETAVGIKQGRDAAAEDRTSAAATHAAEHADAAAATHQQREFEQHRQTESDLEKKQNAREKTLAPVQGAMDYADTYQQSKHTGPGDEALMEKFFELAKPSTGFRMSQPQITMLTQARSWMEGTKALAYHALTGTWFSDQQRQEIIATMKALGEAKVNRTGEARGQQAAAGGSGKDLGAAPAGKPDGATGTLPDGTKVKVQGGRLITQ